MLLSFLLIQFVQLMNDSLKQLTVMVWGVQGVFGTISFPYLSSVSNMNNVHNTFFVFGINEVQHVLFQLKRTMLSFPYSLEYSNQRLK